MQTGILVVLTVMLGVGAVLVVCGGGVDLVVVVVAFW